MIVPWPKSKFALISFTISLVLTIVSLVLIIWVFPDVIINEIYKSSSAYCKNSTINILHIKRTLRKPDKSIANMSSYRPQTGVTGIVSTPLFTQNVELAKGTEQYDRFLELPFPLTFKVYFFNVENPSEVAKGEKPIVKEVGPYVYKQYRRKSVTATDDENDTISYTLKESFEFDYEASGKFSDEDLVTTLNIPMMSILQIADDYGQAGLLSRCLKNIFPGLDTLFITTKVKDILFDGIGFCPRRFSLCVLTNTVACDLTSTKKNIDPLDDGSLKFSFFNYKTKKGALYTIKRGIKNANTLGRIILLNNLKYTNYWERLGPNSTCDEVKGTDSTVYPPQIKKNSVLQVYSTDICRYVEINFVKEAFYKEIEGFMFATDNSTFRSIKNSTNDDCFCAKQTKGVDGNDSCFLDGVIDMQPCTGAPVLLSFPHFLWANKFYTERVDGMLPNEELHKTYLIIEPETGTPLQGATRIQINAVLRPIRKINLTKDLPRVVLPLLWIEEGFSLTDKFTNKLEDMYFHKVKIVNISKWTFLGASIALTLIFGFYLIRKKEI